MEFERPPKDSQLAVLLIDAQIALLRPESAYRAHEVVRALQELLDFSRKANLPIVLIQHDGRDGSWIGEEEWELHPALELRRGEPVFHKRASDAFYDTPLDQHFRTMGVDTIVVAGCQTQYCVDTTCRRAMT